ncbi:MAG: alanine--tRNA ligase [Chloroflexota bacterium]
MNSDEIRSAFLRFFAGKDHKVIPSSSLVPHDDPSLLLTTAGMVQIKPYFLGEAVPPNPRLASCQKCFRTTDVESVGDASHLTFFEMLGNFSVGDYFKKEAIAWAWEFVIDWLKLPPGRLWITIYQDDDVAFDFWREIGVPAARIRRFGDEDNFWGPAGNSGPCGPCSEIHYDFGEEWGCGQPDCGPNCACGRFSEMWNLVFTEYNQDESGERTLLPRPNIDTGMGLERATAAVNGKHTVYDTNVFAPLLQAVSEPAGKRYGEDAEIDMAMRVVAEHGRGIAFLIADGVIPSNEKQGYVLRRLLRRAALYCRRLGGERSYPTAVAEATIQRLGPVYPEIAQRREFILRVIELEEARFRETLNTGLEIIEELLSAGSGDEDKAIPGAEAFKLYDTYGFPVELTREIVSQSGFTVDMAGFEREMDKQRERARAAHKFDVGATVKQGRGVDLAETDFVGYHRLAEKASVVRLLVDGAAVETVNAGQEAGLVLDRTPFYGEMGGQVGDTGEIRGAGARFAVTDSLRMSPEVIVHQGNVVEGTLRVGDEVLAEVDLERRRDIARNHTATHLLQAALRRVLGEHVQQRGSLVAPDHLRFDFSHLEAMSREEIGAVERSVNEKVRLNLPVHGAETSFDEAIKTGAIALFNEKYGDVVRVMTIGEPVVSAELCGGTHIDHTGEIGYFRIISESSIGAGLRRIEAVTGRGAEEYLNRQLAQVEEVAKSLGTTVEGLSEKVTGLRQELDRERKQVEALESELARREAEALLRQVEETDGVKMLVARVPSADQQVLREMADLIRERLQSVVLVLGTVHQDRPAFLAAVTPDLVAKGYHAGDIVREVAKVTGGGGGGKPTLAQAGGKDKDRVEEALQMARSLISRR